METNFGESPFLFDFEGMLVVRRDKILNELVTTVYSVQEMQAQTRQSIEDYPLQVGQGAWQSCLHKLVLGYLVHHGYCNTAAVFASTTSQTLEEDWVSIRNRQSKCWSVTSDSC